MKYLYGITLLLLSLNAWGQKRNAAEKALVAPEKKYEMKQYYFVMLTKGARRDAIRDTAVINELQRGHMANMGRLADEGKLVLAGPFGDDGNWRDIFILDVKDEAEARAILDTDPAIAAGRLDYELHPWWTAKNCHFK